MIFGIRFGVLKLSHEATHRCMTGGTMVTMLHGADRTWGRSVRISLNWISVFLFSFPLSGRGGDRGPNAGVGTSRGHIKHDRGVGAA